MRIAWKHGYNDIRVDAGLGDASATGDTVASQSFNFTDVKIETLHAIAVFRQMSGHRTAHRSETNEANYLFHAPSRNRMSISRSSSTDVCKLHKLDDRILRL